MKKITTMILTVIALGAQFLCHAEDNTWKTLEYGFDYKGDGIACKIGKSGRLINIKIADKVVISSSYVLGNPEKEKEENYDERIVQYFKNSNAEIKIKEISDNSFLLKIEGCLGNDKYSQTANYNQTIRLMPDEILVKCEVIFKENLKMRIWNIFRTRCIIPQNVLVGATVKLINSRDQASSYKFPKKFDKNSRNITNVKKIIQENIWGNLFFSADNKTNIVLQDGRRHNQKNFILTFRPLLPYSKYPQNYLKGQKLEWEWKIGKN